MVSSRTWFVSFSLLVHGAFAVGIGEIEIPKLHAATAIEIAETTKKAEPPTPEPTQVEPEPPKQREPRAARARAEPLPANEPPPPPDQKAAAESFDALPDFGLALHGGAEGQGLALPAGGPPAARPNTVQKAVPRALSAKPSEPEDTCTEPPAKPKLLSIAQPAYTDPAARSAGLTGKVRVEIAVDSTGRVVDVKLLQGLSPGLDAAAIAAARGARFEAAVRCGNPVRASFKVSIRFEL